jgi:hypothetical protein
MKKIIKHYPMTDRLIVRRGYVHCLKIYNSFALTSKQCKKVCQKRTYLPVSKARTNKFEIFSQCIAVIDTSKVKVANP